MSVHQRFIRGVLNPIDIWRAGDQAKLRFLEEFDRSQFLPLQDLFAMQFERLRTLLEHVYRRCPFYKRDV